MKSRRFVSIDCASSNSDSDGSSSNDDDDEPCEAIKTDWKCSDIDYFPTSENADLSPGGAFMNHITTKSPDTGTDGFFLDPFSVETTCDYGPQKSFEALLADLNIEEVNVAGQDPKQVPLRGDSPLSPKCAITNDDLLRRWKSSVSTSDLMYSSSDSETEASGASRNCDGLAGREGGVFCPVSVLNEEDPDEEEGGGKLRGTQTIPERSVPESGLQSCDQIIGETDPSGRRRMPDMCPPLYAAVFLEDSVQVSVVENSSDREIAQHKQLSPSVAPSLTADIQLAAHRPTSGRSPQVAGDSIRFQPVCVTTEDSDEDEDEGGVVAVSTEDSPSISTFTRRPSSTSCGYSSFSKDAPPVITRAPPPCIYK